MKDLSSLLVFLLALGVLALLAGCGGGGSSAAGSVGRISGSVLNQPNAGMTRQPVDDIVVGIDGSTISTQVAADGSFLLDHVPAGLHTLYAMTADGQHALALVAQVTTGQETHIGEILLTGAGWITGMVTSATDGTPISDAQVTATDQVTANPTGEQAHPIRMAITERDGTYVLRGLPAGSYAVTIARRGYAAVSLSLTVTAGQTTTGDTTLKPVVSMPGGMAGTVTTTTSTGQTIPLPGALVRLVPPATQNLENPLPMNFTRSGQRILQPIDEYYTFTDENGAYQLDGVPAGQYIAVAVRPGFNPARQPVTIGDAAIQVNFSLQPHVVQVGAIIGTVTDKTTGKPITGAFVQAMVGPQPGTVSTASTSSCVTGVIGPEGSDFHLGAITDQNGHYQLKVPIFVTAIAAGAEGYLPQFLPVTVQEGVTVTVDIALQQRAATAGTVQGAVIDATTGNPISGATVIAISPLMSGQRVMMPIMPPDFSTITDANGHYQLTVPSYISGIYFIASGYLPQNQPVTVIVGGTVEVNAKLSPANSQYTLSGRVSTMQADGSIVPAAGATVVAMPGGSVEPASTPVPPVVYTATTDAQGYYSLSLPSGSFNVHARKETLISQPIIITMNGNVVQDFILRPRL